MTSLVERLPLAGDSKDSQSASKQEQFFWWKIQLAMGQIGILDDSILALLIFNLISGRSNHVKFSLSF